MCHLVLSVPILGLVLFFFLPFSTALAIYLGLTAASGFIYYKLVRALRSGVQTGLESMIGQEALALEDIDPEGRVQIMGELWNARTQDKPIKRGKKVRITGVRNLVLLVEDAHS